MSGRPLLSYGPSETATNCLLSKYGLGKILNERSVNKLVSTIYKIIDEYPAYVQNAKSKKHLIEQTFSAEKVREKNESSIKKYMNFIWSFIFQSVRLRRRVLHYLCNNYFHELKFSIPLGNNYWANLLENDSYDPFSEIFICQEYADFIPNEPILKLIDIGANYGYFSLWLQSKIDNYPLKSLMIEASPKCKRSLQKSLMTKNYKFQATF